MFLISSRIFIVTGLFQVAIIFGLQAQTREKPTENVGKKSQKYSLGVRLGPTITIGAFSKVLPDTVRRSHSNQVKIGFTAVGQLLFPLKHDWTCLIEAGYARGGRKIKYNNGDWQNDFTYNYATTALGLRRYFKWNMGAGRFWEWYVNIGPNVSYLTSAKGMLLSSNGGKHAFNVEFTSVEDSEWLSARNKETKVGTYYLNNANRFFFGLDIGLGLDVPITNRQKVYTEVRTTLGGTYIGNRRTLAAMGGIPNTLFSDPLKTNMTTIQFSAVYTLDFDKKMKNKGKSTIDNRKKKKKR